MLIVCSQIGGGYRFLTDFIHFSVIPGSPIAYWVSTGVIEAFKQGTSLGVMAEPRQGMIPGNVDAFVRFWHEVSLHKIGFNHITSADIKKYGMKWFPYNKGGAFRRWYGNIEHVINMENDGYAIKHSGLNNNYRLREPELYFKEALTWSKIAGGGFSMRYMPSGCLFDIAGCCVFGLSNKINYVLAFTNSKVVNEIMSFLSPTLNFEVDHIKKLPIVVDNDHKAEVEELVVETKTIMKNDWDCVETSWNFKKHPLI